MQPVGQRRRAPFALRDTSPMFAGRRAVFPNRKAATARSIPWDASCSWRRRPGVLPYVSWSEARTSAGIRAIGIGGHRTAVRHRNSCRLVEAICRSAHSARHTPSGLMTARPQEASMRQHMCHEEVQTGGGGPQWPRRTGSRRAWYALTCIVSPCATKVRGRIQNIAPPFYLCLPLGVLPADVGRGRNFGLAL